MVLVPARAQTLGPVCVDADSFSLCETIHSLWALTQHLRYFGHSYLLTLLQKQFPEEQVYDIILSILFSFKTGACGKDMIA